MPKYEVRTNCEYVLEVEAASEEEAIDKAMGIELGEWNQAWAQVEAEQLDIPPHECAHCPDADVART